MSKKVQNLVVLMEPSEDAHDISLKGGNMILNRFCIDEDAAFELSGVSYLEKSSLKLRNGVSLEKEKGKECSMNTVHSYGMTHFRYLQITENVPIFPGGLYIEKLNLHGPCNMDK